MCIRFVIAISLLFIGCATMDPRYKEVNKLHDDALVKKTTPFVSDELLSTEYQDKFAVEVCELSLERKKWTIKQRAACDQKLKNTFEARLVELYPYADANYLTKKCNAYPAECNDSKNLETWARENHNENIELSRKQKLQVVQNMQNEEESEDSEKMVRAGAALTDFGNGLKPKPSTNCKTTQFMGTYKTTCN